MLEKTNDKDISKDLKRCIEIIRNITDISNKTKSSNKSFLELSTFKKIEDGILDSIHKANPKQIESLLNGYYKFQYYTELNENTNLKNEFRRILRNIKIKEILKN